VYAFALPLLKPVDSQWLVFHCGVSPTSRAFSAREREVAPGLLALVRSGEGLLGMR
jgi:hypothetical protein